MLAVAILLGVNYALVAGYRGTGRSVHVYYAEGTEVEFWNVGSFADNEASEDEVLLSMGEFMVGER